MLISGTQLNVCIALHGALGTHSDTGHQTRFLHKLKKEVKVKKGKGAYSSL